MRHKRDDSKAPPVHVNLARASTVFEWAALEKIMKANEKTSEADKRQCATDACTLLIMGIRQDSYYKGRTGGMPSIRLFDLLRTIMCRCGLAHQFHVEFDQLVQETDKLVKGMDFATKTGKKKRVHRYSHTRFKPADFQAQDGKPKAPERLWDKSCWDQQQKQWETRRHEGPQRKTNLASKEGSAEEGAKPQMREWNLRKEKWKSVDCGARLLDPMNRVTWRLPFWPESLLKRQDELSKLSAEDRRKSRCLNTPLDIPGIEIPFLIQ